MKLNEIFNSTFPVKKVLDNKLSCVYEGEIDGDTFKFIAIDERELGELDYPDSDPRAGKIWDISFGIQGKNNHGEIDYYATGKGNAFKIFATGIDCLKKFIKEHPKVEEITFGGNLEETSRIKLYDRANFLKIPGWTYRGGAETHNDFDSSKKYHLIKNK